MVVVVVVVVDRDVVVVVKGEVFVVVIVVEVNVEDAVVIVEVTEGVEAKLLVLFDRSGKPKKDLLLTDNVTIHFPFFTFHILMDLSSDPLASLLSSSS